jgi:hypothetical protein
MATSKNFFKNNLDNLESTSEFSRVLVVFIQSMLDSVANLLQQHWFKSICFPVTFILGYLSIFLWQLILLNQRIKIRVIVVYL